MKNILEVKNLVKNFGPVEVLKSVDFDLKKGEVKALLGANGAGKTTLIKIICGAHERTSGTILLKGNEVNFKNSHESMVQGISVIHQELSLVPTLTVLENMFLGREEILRKFFIDKNSLRKKYDEISTVFDFKIDGDRLVSDLTIAERQMVEIMKTISTDADVIIMDEPTTSLTDNEKKGLFKMIKKLQKSGKSIIYITHILDEVFELCDTAAIMVNGRMIGDFNVETLTKSKIAELMVGRVTEVFSEAYNHAQYDKKPALEVENLKKSSIIKDVNFKIYPGEVVGFAGLVGSKRTEIINLIYGIDKKDSGTVKLNGKEIRIDSPKDAIGHGIGLIPEDRKNFGLILNQEMYKNSTAIQIDKFIANFFLNKGMEIEFAKEKVNQLGIKLNSVSQKMKELSGGNQQKVVISKWIGEQLDLLIYDEPTKGIDINAKEDVFKTIFDFSKNGSSVLFVSSDLEEVIRVSDRIYVISNGEIIDEIVNDNVNEKDLMSSIFGIKESKYEDI